jgi:hypothetical protein
MTYDEFIKRLSKTTCKPQKVSDVDWETIQLVYTFHPAISNTEGKDQIVELYCAMGMPFIRAMAPQAEVCQKIEDTLRCKREELQRREASLQESINRVNQLRVADIAQINQRCQYEIDDIRAGFNEGVAELMSLIQDMTFRLGQLEGGETK